MYARSPEQQITRGQVFGAYASGTNLLHSAAAQNFMGVHMMPTDNAEGKENFGWKHNGVGSLSSQDIDGELVTNQLVPLDWELSADTLLMVAYREPISWIRSLHRQPHHAPQLWDMELVEFLQAPWQAYATDDSTEFSPQEAERLRPYIRPDNIVDEYASVFAMRLQSIARFEDLAGAYQHVAYLCYEAFKTNQGLEAHIRALANHYNIPTNPEFQPVDTYKGSGTEPYRQTVYRPLSPKTLAFIINQLNWDEEARLGYQLSEQGTQILDGRIPSEEECLRHLQLLDLETPPASRFFIQRIGLNVLNSSQEPHL